MPQEAPAARRAGRNGAALRGDPKNTALAIIAATAIVLFAAAFAAIALAVNHAARIEEQVRVAQGARASVLRWQLEEDTGIRGYAATHDRIFLEPYWNAQQPIKYAFVALRAALVQLAPRLVPVVDDARTFADEVARQSDSFAMYLVYAIIAVGLVFGAGLLGLVAEMGRRQALLDKDLRATNAALSAAAKAKDNFLASMSHELRTPLNAIMGFTGTLLMRLAGPLTGQQEDQLRIVQTSSRHLLSLINDILDLAKIESAKIEVHYEVVDVYGVADDVMSALRGLAEQKGVRIEVKSYDRSITATTDKRILQQILTNLVNNAIKYTENGFVRIEVSEREDGSREWIDFDVVDSGLGIDAGSQSRIFEAFERIDNSATRNIEGVGLGLYLSHRFAAIVDGRLAVRSAVGAGSTFTLSLPHHGQN